MLNIDFDQLLNTETDEEIRAMHRYFRIVPPQKNAFTGKYQGYNLILITAEAFHLAVRKTSLPPCIK